MITEIKEVYKCEHCRKLYQRKHSAIKHELMCGKNPANQRDCFNCIHLEKKEYEHEEYYGDNSHIRKFNFFHCDLIKSFLHPPQCEIKGNAFDLDEPNQPMPIECEPKKRQEKIMGSIFNLR